MLGGIADLLTLVRLAAAPVLTATLAAGRLAPAAALLALGWLTDALDGPAARADGTETRLGRFDLLADTAAGAGALAGLALAGEIPAALAGTLLAVLGTGYLVLRNPALSMALQAIGYAWLLWTLWDQGESAVWLPLVTVAGLLLLLHRRLFQVAIPAFLRGLATLGRRRKRFEL
jgi:phosphatidylglycerophosphate synthase